MSMMKKSGFFLLIVSLWASVVHAQTLAENYQKAQQILMDGVEATGGLQAFRSIGDVQLSLKGTAYDEGQSASPYAPWFEREMNADIIFKSREGISVEKINTLTIGGLLYDPVFVLNPDNTGLLHQPSTNEWFELQGMDISILKGIPQLYPPRLFPFQVIRNALRNASGLRFITETADAYHLAVPEQDGTQLTLVFSKETHLLQRLEMLGDHLVFGDLVLQIRYTDYRPIQGVQMPHRLVFAYGDRPFIDLQTNQIEVNATPEKVLFELPPQKEFTSLPPPFTLQKVGDGVWFFPVFSGLGTTYNVLLVEFGNYFLVVDAPLFDGYSRTIQQMARSLSANKPIRYVVTTHYHTDHIGGIGQFVASGSTIITNQANQTFLQLLTQVQHTIFPNALTFNPTDPIIETYAKQKNITDNQQNVVLYEINDSPHVEDMTLVYLPNEKLLFVADLLMVPHNGAPPPDNPSLRFLKAFIQAQKLEVERFAPAHGVIIDKATFEQ